MRHILSIEFRDEAFDPVFDRVTRPYQAVVTVRMNTTGETYPDVFEGDAARSLHTRVRAAIQRTIEEEEG